MRQFGGSLFAFCRLHFFKILAGILLFFLMTQYATNVMVRRSTLPRLISTNFSFISSAHRLLGWAKDEVVLNTSATSVQTIAPSVSNSAVTATQTLPTIVNSTVNRTAAFNVSETTALPLCPLVPPKLVGKLKVLTDAPSFTELESLFSDLDPGGRYAPKECTSRNRVAIIVPYRDREQHLRIFLHNIHPILMRQQLDYGIYIVEEQGDTKFNRAMLMNIGFVEALKQHDYQCFIFHDVDLIPEDDRNIYSCPQQPRHMSVAIDLFNYRLPYADLFGGVSALSRKHMETVNGFSNEYWGWGGEDDDMSNRLKFHGFHISRYPANVARYKMLKHNKDQPNPDRYNKLYKGKQRYKSDGLVNLKYKVHDLVLKKLYTWVLVEIHPKK